MITIRDWLSDDRLPPQVRMLLALEVFGQARDEQGETIQLTDLASKFAQDCLHVLTDDQLIDDDRASAVTALFNKFNRKGDA